MDVFVLCCVVHWQGGSWWSRLLSDSSYRQQLSELTYSKTSADTGAEGCRPSIFCVLQLHKCKSRHIFMLEGREAVLELRCVLLGCVIGISLLPTVQTFLKVLRKSANSCEAGKSKGRINAAWTF
jgi:hypothetical protein